MEALNCICVPAGSTTHGKRYGSLVLKVAYTDARSGIFLESSSGSDDHLGCIP